MNEQPNTPQTTWNKPIVRRLTAGANSEGGISTFNVETNFIESAPAPAS